MLTAARLLGWRATSCHKACGLLFTVECGVVTVLSQLSPASPAASSPLLCGWLAGCPLCAVCVCVFSSFIQQQIIAQTAKFVRGNGFAVEVKLRVQQAGNPKFDFLNTQDRLFPYYRCVFVWRWKNKLRLD